MLAYLLRQLTGGVVRLFLAAFVTYTALMYTPAGPPYVIMHPPRFASEGHVELTIERFELDKPWPLNFLAYLYDPGETTEVVFGKTYPKGIQVQLFGLGTSGSGILTGDFGRSLVIAKQVPVADMYGRGFDLLFAVLLGMVLTFGYVAIVQRLRPRDSHAMTLDFADAMRA
jgi:ABC-type dipeptide/oligopeptide/nickel transport system permease component